MCALKKHSRAYATVRLATIKENFSLLTGMAREQFGSFYGSVAMIKADAYGHGLLQVAQTLVGAKGLLALGVATTEEGVLVRQAGVKGPIWVFSGSGPATNETLDQCERFALTPIVHNLEGLRLLLKPKYEALVRSHGFHLKFNSGMNRLGIAPEEVGVVERMLNKSRLSPAGLCSHFAASDEPAHRLNRVQVGRFREIVCRFAGSRQSRMFIHASNTAAILNGTKLGLAPFCNVVRPGIGLYGYGGRGGDRLGLKPSLKLCAQVIESRDLSPAQAVGYGATYRTARQTKQAVLSIGYADGFSRALSNREILVSTGSKALRRTPVLGRVSMDLTSIGLGSKSGSWVTLLGENGEQGEWMALAAGTIIYEVLTSISKRIPRDYR